MKKVLKVIGIILLVLAVIATGVYFFVLQYPEIKENPKEGKWYRVSGDEMKASDGSSYRAFFKKGSENKVMVYFAGGGVSVNEKSARDATYFTKLIGPDAIANYIMNQGGLVSNSKENPFRDWTFILFPYATGDFHCGTSEFPYTDKDGTEKILYHNGYINFTSAMDKIMACAGLDNPEDLVVTGYSAGGWGASLLADDVFSNYFPDSGTKTLLVDSSLIPYDGWKKAAEEVWKAPQHISERIVSNNIMLDSVTALHEKWGEDVTILFDSSTRDGDLAQVRRYLETGEIDEKTGKMFIDEQDGDKYQQFLKETIPLLKEQAGASVFIWDGLPWYNAPRNLTQHTIIYTSETFKERNGTGCSIGQWLLDAVEGNPRDYGLELLDKQY